MLFLPRGNGSTFLGLAYGPGVSDLARSARGLVDYVEMPFEQLRHRPDLASLQDEIPLVLHCASLSVAGFVAPGETTIDAVAAEAGRMGTPWIGEHLAFISADALHADGEPTALTYTLCPQLSEQTVERVVENVARLRPRLGVPMIVENSPQYFDVPGSTMSMVEFIGAVAARADVDLLLDLSHFAIMAANTGVDVVRELERLPLERVVEIHISGFSFQSGIAWDDHASPAPALLFELLERVLARVRPRAVTLEYNWSAAFPRTVLLEHAERTRALLEAA